MPKNLQQITDETTTTIDEPEEVSGVEHFAGIETDEPEGYEPEGGEGSDGLSGPGRLTKEQFRKTFTGAFNVGGTVTKLRSLCIEPDAMEGAEAAADAIYDTALEIPWLHWMVEPNNIHVQRAVVIGAFTVPKALAVRGELAARREARKAPKEKPQDEPKQEAA